MPALSPEQRRVVLTLREVAERAGMALDEEKALELCLRFPDRDHAAEAEALRWWRLEGRGVNSRRTKLTETWMNWLKGAPPAGQPRRRNNGAAPGSFLAAAEEMERTT